MQDICSISHYDMPMVFATVCSVDGRSVTLPGKAKKSGEQSTEAGNSGYRGGEARGG